jgi:hypothetical protein
VVWAEMYRAFGGQPQSEKKKGASWGGGHMPIWRR